MPGPYLPDLVRMVVTYTDTAYGEAQNTFHFLDTSGVDFTTMALAVAARWEAWWGTGALNANQLRNWITNQLRPTRFRFTDMSVAGGAFVDVNPTVLAGNEAQRMPPDLAVVVGWRTGFTGGSKRGRTYIPGLATNASNPATGRVATACATGLSTGATTFRGAMAAGLTNLVVYSRVGAGAATLITQAGVDDHWDVQRRRGN